MTIGKLGGTMPDDNIDYHYASRGQQAPGRLATSNSSSNADSASGNQKEEKKQQDFASLIQRLEEAHQQLLNQLNSLYQQLNELYEQRDQSQEKLTAIESYLEEHRNTGEFGVGENGYPLNPLVANIVKQWEQNTGQQFNPHNEEQVLALMLAAKAQTEQDLSGIDSKIGDTINEIDAVSASLQTTEEMLEESHHHQYSAAEITLVLDQMHSNSEYINQEPLSKQAPEKPNPQHDNRLVLDMGM